MPGRVTGCFNYRHASGSVIAARVLLDYYDTSSFKFNGTTTTRPYHD
jgi:hypothetical protein